MKYYGDQTTGAIGTETYRCAKKWSFDWHSKYKMQQHDKCLQSLSITAEDYDY